MRSAWGITKDEAGAGFTTTLPSVSRPMVSWWPNGAVFPPRRTPVMWTYPLPPHRRTSALGARRVRAERHNPWSVATLRQIIARILLRQLPSCPFFVEFLFYSTVVLVLST